MQKLAGMVSGALGRESAVIRALRPAYERLLDLSTGGRGVLRTLNGKETFFIDPRCRRLFPEIYEPQVCDYLRARVQPGAVCLNIGAHVGIYALCLAQWAGPKGRVFAFEPNPRARRLLASNVVRNFPKQIEVSPDAVTAEIGEADFFAASGEGYSRLGSPNPANAATSHQMRVTTTTVDSFCRQHRIVPDWLVIDVEGYEGAVLAGARRTLEAARAPVIVVEMHPHLWELAGTSRAQMEALFAALGLATRELTSQSEVFAEAGVIELRRGDRD